ncbi:hypothetical protein Skr01_54970 [Sphaerisporangium krabiense]|uniref:Uncharacterized protein n=1 Tax=Sphaerisporangium krabiense TaxID=763782 RepID=A0A7W8ZBF7_9ACTN|nr:hypothetical protein [Sphaerisporangium krabiense]MBB5630904.1 hypothetical protein [Sphaerisporangium krabiense]GII65412.1 hypothetical protein Skr01_54970 [Sphaerisporangium krabiense]
MLGPALVTAVTELTGSRHLIVFEVTAGGVTVFDVHRDDTGTPRGLVEPLVPREGGVVAAARLAADLPRPRPGDTTVILRCASPADPRAAQAAEVLRAANPGARVFTEPGARAGDALRRAISEEPLTQPYDLVVLRRHPREGTLHFAGHPLFGREARSGDHVELTVRCEPSDDRGTVFAVTAWEDHRRPRLVSAHAAKLAPGPYKLQAELERPGRVRFHGLPDAAERCEVPWGDLVAAVPPRLDRFADPAHLICAIQLSGPYERVLSRVQWVGGFLGMVADGPQGWLRVSLVTYGSHAVHRGDPEQPARAECERVTPEQAQEALHRLEERRLPGMREAMARGYPYAARIEDMLVEAGRLVEAAGRGPAALLTVGDRPPHPPRTDLSEIIPCRDKHDWESLLTALERDHAVTFAAVCDLPAERAHRAWSRLGGGAPAELATADAEEVCARLGLAVPPVQPVPFPFIAV